MPSKLRAKQAKIEAKKDTLPSPPKKMSTNKKTNQKQAKQAQSPQKAPNPKKSETPLISPNKRSAPIETDNKDAISGIKKIKSDEQIVKAATKSGAVIDEIVPNKDEFKIFREGKKVYSAILSKENPKQNKFYIIQALQHVTTGDLYIWNRWGKVGAQGLDALKGPFSNQKAVLSEYDRKYFDKTAKRDYHQSKSQSK